MDDEHKEIVQRIEAQAVASRRHALATHWSLADAEALLRLAPSVEHVDLCAQSLMIQQCVNVVATEEEIEETLSFALGRIASWSSVESLDAVLTQHVPWLRILELAWLCRAYAFMRILLRDPLFDHEELESAIAAADSDYAAAKSLGT